MATKRSLPNMSEVAEHARVSLATVDRVLHGRPGVRAPTVARVMAAAKALGYAFDAPATEAAPAVQLLNIGILLPDTGPGFLSMLKDVIDYTNERWKPFMVNCHVETYQSLNPQDCANAMLLHGKRYDGIAVTAQDDPAVCLALNELAAQGVPVVTLTTDLKDATRTAYVGIDNRAAGRTAAYLITQLLGPRVLQPRVKLAVVAGSLTYRSHVEREAGFMQFLEEKFSAIQVVSVFEGQDDDEISYQKTRALLERHPDLAGIYANSGGASGVAQALKEFKLEHKVVFIGHALSPETRSLLIDGTMDASIVQSHPHLVGNCVRVFANLRDGKALTVGLDSIRIQTVFRENLP